MKKVIFISALAIAAAVSCTKSDIVDTKFNEQISFETYTGRDAMTKATVVKADNIVDLGLYGFYTGAGDWGTSTNANLWANLQLVSEDGWTIPANEKKYWTNDQDNYTFFAYSPFATGTGDTGNGLVAPEKSETVTEVKNPSVTYTLSNTIADQIDLLYSNNNFNRKKPETQGEAVTLQMKHALSRITVKASESTEAFDYTIQALNIKGKFVESASLNLKEGTWSSNAAGTERVYSFLNATDVTTDDILVPDTRVIEGKETKTPFDFATLNSDNNYLMAIPTDLTGDNAIQVVVTYTTTFAEQVSRPMTKYVTVAQNFLPGKAYSINLVFAPNTDNEITFTVKVDNWDDVADDDADGDLNDDSEFTDPDEETGVDGGNPENGTEVK
jgi:hypothetical protein